MLGQHLDILDFHLVVHGCVVSSLLSRYGQFGQQRFELKRLLKLLSGSLLVASQHDGGLYHELNVTWQFF